MPTSRKLATFWLSTSILAAWLSAASAADPVTLRFSLWRDNSTWDGTMAVIDAFMASHPDIKIQVETYPGNYEDKLVAMHLGGSSPDVILSQDEPFQALADAGVFMDITELVKRDHAELQAQLDDYWPTQLQVTQYHGRYYGLPGQVGGGVVIYYNRDLFDRAGLAYPTDNWTLNDFVEDGKRLTLDDNGDGKIDQWATSLPSWPYTLDWIWTFGGSVLDSDHTHSTLNSPYSVEALQFIQNLLSQDRIAPAPGVAGGNWTNGTQAMWFTGTWSFGSAQAATFNWDVANLPMHPERGTRGTRVTWNIATISPETKHLKEAWEFVKYFSSIPASRILWEKSRMAFPPSVQVAKTMIDPSTPQHEEVLINALLDYGRLQPINPHWQEMSGIINSYLSKLKSGKISAKTMAAQATTEIDALFVPNQN